MSDNINKNEDDTNQRIILANTKNIHINGNYLKPRSNIHRPWYCCRCYHMIDSLGCPKTSCICYGYNPFDLSNLMNNYTISKFN